MKDFETIEAGAGSYPEPPESEYKCFNFKAVVTSEVEGYVWAKNKGEAYDLIMNGQWEELTNQSVEQVMDIDELEEE